MQPGLANYAAPKVKKLNLPEYSVKGLTDVKKFTSKAGA